MNEVGAILFTSVVGGLIALWGIMSHRAIERRRTTLEYLWRNETDHDVIEATKKFVELAKKDHGLIEWATEPQEPSDEVQKIRLVLNQYELIAIGIQRGIIDYHLYERWARSATIQAWSFAVPFVAALRTRKKNDALYHETEELVRWLKGNPMPRRSRWRGIWV